MAAGGYSSHPYAHDPNPPMELYGSGGVGPHERMFEATTAPSPGMFGSGAAAAAAAAGGGSGLDDLFQTVPGTSSASGARPAEFSDVDGSGIWNDTGRFTVDVEKATRATKEAARAAQLREQSMDPRSSGDGAGRVEQMSTSEILQKRFVFYFDSLAEDPRAQESRDIALEWLHSNPAVSSNVHRQDIAQLAMDEAAAGGNLFEAHPWLLNHPVVVDTQSKFVLRPDQGHVIQYPEFMSYMRDECVEMGGNCLSMNDIKPKRVARHRQQRLAPQSGVVSQMKHVGHHGDVSMQGRDDDSGAVFHGL